MWLRKEKRKRRGREEGGERNLRKSRMEGGSESLLPGARIYQKHIRVCLFHDSVKSRRRDKI